MGKLTISTTVIAFILILVCLDNSVSTGDILTIGGWLCAGTLSLEKIITKVLIKI